MPPSAPSAKVTWQPPPKTNSAPVLQRPSPPHSPRLAELAAALLSRPPQPRTPAGQVTTGDIIGHPGYRFQPFRVSAPPYPAGTAIEITGCLTDPADGEPAGQITLALTRAGHLDPVVHLIPPPARSLRSLLGGTTAADGHPGRD